MISLFYSLYDPTWFDGTDDNVGPQSVDGLLVQGVHKTALSLQDAVQVSRGGDGNGFPRQYAANIACLFRIEMAYSLMQ